MKQQDNKYYVYAYLDPRKPGNYTYNETSFEYEPFYIGKGSGKRYLAHLNCKGKNKYLNNKINKIISLGLKPMIIKIEENLEEEYSYEREHELIKKIGQLYENTGPLLNVQKGGRGKIGFSEESKKKIGQNNSNRKWTDERRSKHSERYKGENNPMFGKTHTKKVKDYISSIHKGRKNTDETKKLMSKNYKYRKPTPEHIQTLKDYMTNRIVSDETKKKLSESKKGIKANLDTKLKMSKISTNKKKGKYKKRKEKPVNYNYFITIEHNDVINNFIFLKHSISYLNNIYKNLPYGILKGFILSNYNDDIVKINCVKTMSDKRITSPIPKRTLTNIEKEEIIKMYEMYYTTITMIHKQLNIPEIYIKNYLLKHYKINDLKILARIKTSKNKHNLSDETKELIKNTYIMLKNMTETAKIVKLSRNIVKTYLDSINLNKFNIK